MNEIRKPIGEPTLGADDGVSVATHLVAAWLENDGLLYQRAKDIAMGGEVYGIAGDLSGWVNGIFLQGRTRVLRGTH